jgi:hypothetical protein
MHGLKIDGVWTIPDQAEICDALTTHSYPAFVPYCFLDPVSSMKIQLMAAAQSCYYGDIGKRPCLIEEIGILGNMVASEETGAEFVRVTLFSQWAHGHCGFMWWCNSDQEDLDFPPYDWCAMERELGLFRTDGSSKPVTREITGFRAFLKSLPFKRLPAPQKDAVCILSERQDHWAAAFSSFVLSKQAGFDIAFSGVQDIPKSKLYLLPCVKGDVMHRQFWKKMLSEVSEGAALYISFDEAMISGFEEMTGLRVIANSARKNQFETIRTADGETSYNMQGHRRLTLEAVRASVIAREEDGNPAFTEAAYGKGTVYFLGFPLERILASQADSISKREHEQFYTIYQHIAKGRADRAVARKSSPFAGITEHPTENGKVVTAINYDSEKADLTLELSCGWKLNEIIRGSVKAVADGSLSLLLEPHHAAVFTLERTSV